MQCTITISKKIALFLTCFFSLFTAQGEEWVMEKSSGYIEILSRHSTLNGIELSDKEIWAKTRVEASMSSLLRLLDDTAQAPNWVDNCIEVKLLKNSDEENKIVQSTFAAPWPLKNRDMVTRSITRVEEDKISIKIDDVGQQYPSQSNTVRMTNIHGEWTCE
jgi:hypothetical protein